MTLIADALPEEEGADSIPKRHPTFQRIWDDAHNKGVDRNSPIYFKTWDHVKLFGRGYLVIRPEAAEAEALFETNKTKWLAEIEEWKTKFPLKAAKTKAQLAERWKRFNAKNDWEEDGEDNGWDSPGCSDTEEEPVPNKRVHTAAE